jgi:hypothetical protein
MEGMVIGSIANGCGSAVCKEKFSVRQILNVHVLFGAAHGYENALLKVNTVLADMDICCAVPWHANLSCLYKGRHKAF